MNVLMLLKHKESVQYIYENNTLRQGLEKMRAHSYTAIPVISDDGKYVGTVSEGDFLYYLVDLRAGEVKNQKKTARLIRTLFPSPMIWERLSELSPDRISSAILWTNKR